MRAKINSVFHIGDVAFEVHQNDENRATLSYIGTKVPKLGAKFTFEDAEWTVIAYNPSKFNNKVMNLELVKDGK